MAAAVDAQSNRATLPSKPKQVLLTNDDGPESPFFYPFAEGLRNTLDWNTYVCIPDSNWSYVSKSLKPPKTKFQVQRKAQDEARVPISPASCVNLGLYQLCRDCDLVISGPNIGHNLGRAAILSSGTVGAALEGCIHGKKAIAISFPFKGYNSWTNEDIDAAVKVALDVTQKLWNDWNEGQHPPGSVFYNVNVPLWSCKEGEVERLETEIDQTVGYTSLYKIEKDSNEVSWSPTGERVFDMPNAIEGGDVAAVRDGHVSITKLAPTFQSMKNA